MKRKIIIGIDASRNRSGGAQAHIIGILTDLKLDTRIKEVHVWTYKELAIKLPKYTWLIVHVPDVLNKGIVYQLKWQRYCLNKCLLRYKIDILLSTDAGTVSRFSPTVVMSRDMLSFEKGEMQRYFPSLAWLRLFLLKFMQVSSLRKSEGSIFLTHYARDVIGEFIGGIHESKVIPHGISEGFRRKPTECISLEAPKFIYVSNADKYKHQWHVVEAFYKFRKESGKNATLTLVGADYGQESNKVKASIEKFDDGSNSVIVLDFLPHPNIPMLLHNHDIFIFASSCENMPNTLIEAMASGLPIISSNRGPMPEVLTDDGIFFDPENPESITRAMNYISSSPDFAFNNATKSYNNAKQYSWLRCGQETMNYLIEIHEKFNKGC